MEKKLGKSGKSSRRCCAVGEIGDGVTGVTALTVDHRRDSELDKKVFRQCGSAGARKQVAN